MTFLMLMVFVVVMVVAVVVVAAVVDAVDNFLLCKLCKYVCVFPGIVQMHMQSHVAYQL